MVVRYPPSWPKAKVVPAFATVMDIMPTFLEMAGVQHPAQGEDKGNLQWSRGVPDERQELDIIHEERGGGRC
jgi:arylsulfatase A-like enzyme